MLHVSAWMVTLGILVSEGGGDDEVVGGFGVGGELHAGEDDETVRGVGPECGVAGDLGFGFCVPSGDGVGEGANPDEVSGVNARCSRGNIDECVAGACSAASHGVHGDKHCSLGGLSEGYPKVSDEVSGGESGWCDGVVYIVESTQRNVQSDCGDDEAFPGGLNVHAGDLFGCGCAACDVNGSTLKVGGLGGGGGYRDDAGDQCADTCDRENST